MPLELAMVPGGGVLQLRGAEPYSLTTPTKIAGSADDETGSLSGLTFSTPKVEIERQITEPIIGRVFIDATFSTVTPGAGTIDKDGKVTASLSVRVDLDIEVVPRGSSEPLALGGDCTATPVDLTLSSTAPYDPETERVTLAAGDFSIPAVPTGGSCDAIIGDQVNEELQGSGHSLSLLLEGSVPVPPDGICDTTTDLAVTPSTSSPLGKEVTFTSTTATDPADAEDCAEAAEGGVLGGFVDFSRNGVVIGSGELDGDGTASFSTSGLPAGSHTLTARYRGANPYVTSTSDPVAHFVTVAPQITTNVPAHIRLGQPTEFSYTVSNPGFGEDLDDVHVNITIRTFTAVPTLERLDGTTWVPVPLTVDLPQHLGSLPGFDLAPGGERTERLRITFPSAPPSTPGDLTVAFEVVPADAALVRAPNPDAIGTGTANVVLVKTERVAPHFNYFFGADYAIEPHTVRQGGTLTTYGFFIEPAISGYLPQGHLEFLIDGQVVPVATQLDARPGEEILRVPATGGTTPGPLAIALPPTISTGTHQLTIRYSGDPVFLPAVDTHEFTVVAARGPSYMCTGEGLPPFYMQGNVQAQADLPASAVRGAVELGNLDISLLADRSYLTYSVLSAFLYDDATTAVGEFGLDGVRFTVNGTELSASGLTRSNSFPFVFMGTPYPAPAPEVDHVIALDGESGSFTLEGAAGEVVPVTLDAIEFDLRNFLSVTNVVCIPVGDPAQLGEVRVAAVDLAVSPAGSARAGREVTLTADTGNPSGAGVAEFLDGATTVGVVPLVGGKASMTTSELPAGARSLSVRVFPIPAGPMFVSPAVPLTVLPEFDCAAFAEEGSGAVVRLVYLELLGRCPDEAGFAYWTARLDGGTSPEAFARAIARTPEAVGMVVDDAYQTMLGRAPDAAGRAFWVARLRTSGRYDGLLADLGASGEFWSKAGATNAGFVTRVYERLLDRAPDTGGLDHWVGRLEAGSSRRALIRTLANLGEPLGRLVVASYEEILGRAPNAAERADGIAFLRGSGDRSGLYAQLIGRTEFATRAQGFPNPED